MNNVVLYGVFFLIFLLEILIDFSSMETRSCLSTLPSSSKQVEVSSVLLFHHFIATFMMYGWLLPNRILLFFFLIASLSMFIEWYRFGYCRLTEYINEQCGQTGYFRDLLWWLGLKEVMWFDSYTYQHLIAGSFLFMGFIHFLYYDRIHG